MMRITVLAVAIALGLVTSASAQFLSVEIAGTDVRTGLAPAKAPYTAGGVVVPARPLKPGVTPTAAEFRIRAWTAGDGLRVLVSVKRPERGEQQIASLLLGLDRSVEVTATEKYGARRIVLKAISEPHLIKYRLVVHQGDVPSDPALRLWQPPPRR